MVIRHVAIITVAVLALVVWEQSRVPSAWGGEFHGYACTKDCSGHRAGFAWGERRGIERIEDCGGRSQSFREGCYAWVAESKRRSGQISPLAVDDQKPPSAHDKMPVGTKE
jgi:hypothetical protein